MTALEDARDALPESATITRKLFDFLIRRSPGTDQITVSTGLLAQELVLTVGALEARIIAIEDRLSQ